MEPVWVLLRCYRMLPGGVCLVLGAYDSAGTAITDAERREQIPVDAWQKPDNSDQMWLAESPQYEYKLESFMVPAEPIPPVSIELGTIH